jgi:hypothetical protein
MVESADRWRQVPVHRRGCGVRAVCAARRWCVAARQWVRFLFTPAGWYEQALLDAGFGDLRVENVTGNIVGVTERWLAARAKVEAELRSLEGIEKYEEFEQFLPRPR